MKQLQQNFAYYSGTSTERLAWTPDPRAIITFLETDTRMQYTWNGTAWRTSPATPPQAVAGSLRECLGCFTANVVGSTLVSSLVSIPAGALVVRIQADGGTVRITLDGAAPTATLGYRLDDGMYFETDTPLTSVKLYAAASTAVQIFFYSSV